MTEDSTSHLRPGQPALGAGRRERDIASGELLRARTRARVGIAFVLALLQAGLGFLTAPPFGVRFALLALLATFVVYAAAAGAVHRAAREGASPALVTAMLVSDLGGVYLATAFTTTPAYYERALFGTVALVHVANFSFGRRQAWRVVACGVTGYLALLVFAEGRGMPLERSEQLWSLLVGAACMGFIVVQASDVRRRLRTLIELFDHAGAGDFSHAYDDAADERPDAITRVGRAYNRVRAQLSDMVLTDPLTGCLNRRGFDHAVEREVARASRSSGAFALLALDLDHFKLVNDTWGHVAGDAVLHAIGRLLLRAARAGDVVARVGGEEFAILLADTTSSGAHLFASRLCELIRSHDFVIATSARPIRVTTSIGVVAGSPRGTPGFATALWSNADAALYAAKRAGRDCVRDTVTATTSVAPEAALPFSPKNFNGFLTP